MAPEWRTYLIVNSVEWVLVALLMWMSVRILDMPGWAAATVVVFGVVKDLVLFPFMRHYYRSDLSERRLIGVRGVALGPLAPRGFVRVRGEIWQAERIDVADSEISQGTGVRVCDVRGLLLYVEPL
jgi:membrane protein implicated in regulation of membrane protease activity